MKKVISVSFQGTFFDKSIFVKTEDNKEYYVRSFNPLEEKLSENDFVGKTLDECRNVVVVV